MFINVVLHFLLKARLFGARKCVGTFSDDSNINEEDFSMGPFLNFLQLRSRDKGLLINLIVFKEEKPSLKDPGDWIIQSSMYVSRQSMTGGPFVFFNCLRNMPSLMISFCSRKSMHH